ncbi:MAG: hypothetical protein IPK77_13870 [Cellvibrio sp.]|nr:hypothetical protein [Cellvibrio sp.]
MMLKKISLFLCSLACALSAQAVTLDLLVVHDYKTYSAYGGNPSVRIAAMVNWANFAYANSGTDVKLNLVKIKYLDLPRSAGTPINVPFLERVTNNAGVMDFGRNLFKPALTVYMTNAIFDSVTGLGVCGNAWMPPAPTDIYGGANAGLKAVSVVAYNCSESILAHETGHNLGAGHGAMDGSNGNGNGNGYPIYTSRGYGVQGLFVDAMAYPHLYGVVNNLMIFSSPNIGSCAGLPCGTPYDNAAGGIRQFALQAAKYPMCYPATSPNVTGELGFVWSCQKLCTTTTPINIGMTCSNSSCAESFGRTCYAAGGSANYTGSYSCSKSTTSACPVVTTTTTPTTTTSCGGKYVGTYSTSQTSSNYVGNNITNIAASCGSCGYKFESADRGITVSAYCVTK